uniref:Uncharacterized protein n=1 Tax=Crocodylus porosus TaxID=8502 RepID=A0A7M4FC68_CROPO
LTFAFPEGRGHPHSSGWKRGNQPLHRASLKKCARKVRLLLESTGAKRKAPHSVPGGVHPGGYKPELLELVFYKTSNSDSYSLFYTAHRPICGYCQDTGRARKAMDAETMNMVKWRSATGKRSMFGCSKPKAMMQCLSILFMQDSLA